MKLLRNFIRISILFFFFTIGKLGFSQNDSNDISNRQRVFESNFKLADSLFKLQDYLSAEKNLHFIIKSANIKKDTALFNVIFKSFDLLGKVNFKVQKLDSSTFYYKESLKFLPFSNKTQVEQYYQSGVIKNGMALNMFNTGKTKKSISTIKEAISDYQKYIDLEKDADKKLAGKKKRFASIDNLAGFYRGLGDNIQAINLATYSYNQKKLFLKEGDFGLVFSSLILSHLHLINRDYEQSISYNNLAMPYIKDYPNLKEYAFLVRASTFENLERFDEAEVTYLESEKAYRSQTEIYSFQFLDALIEQSRFYVKIGKSKKAIELATEGYNYTHRKEFTNDLLRLFQTENMALINFLHNDYSNALKYSNEALDFFKTQSMTSLLDSIQNETRKPRSIIINIKSRYALENEKSIAFLEELIATTDAALNTINRRKKLIKSSTDLETLLIDNEDLIDFRKKLLLELYQKTNDKTHLEKLITIHESSLYSRIRSRLSLKQVRFANIPDNVLEKEKLYKENMHKALASNTNISSFFEAEDKWFQFLDSLKLQYPKYHKMRYSTIEEPLDNLQENIPQNTAVVRYMFIDDNLYALVVSKTQKKIHKLDSENLKHKINAIDENQFSVIEMSKNYHNLYKQLWQPFETEIKTKNIIIFPDGELFNLSFETLTPKKIDTFKELAKNSLLAHYNISYNYSLLLLDENKKNIDYSNDFIAFAPGFNEEMKENYKISISDSLNLDTSYLTLLAQPFTAELAEKYSKLFDGSSFTNENASKQIFTNEANEHKIIHIGTHAESNNISPELSRLIFAKNVNDTISSKDNSLYTYEIYNQNLSSNLAILTACETGKPTYQAGEGMISLAHAFNYAGSESILTSLWKIDEQSSATIIESFYGYLKNGLPKDEALQKAKLDYISTAEGRTISPQYWAGLVLIGDSSPIDLNTSSNLIFWLLGIALIIILVFIIRRKKAE